jgi:hypothetical protein
LAGQPHRELGNVMARTESARILDAYSILAIQAMIPETIEELPGV